MSGGITFDQIEIGSFHAVATETGGQAYAWGDGLFGSLGNGLTADRDAPVFVAATTN